MRRFPFWVVVCVVSSSMVLVHAYAKEKNEYYDECLSSFDLDSIDLLSTEAGPYAHLLTEYCGCLGAVKDDVNECARLPESDSCRKTWEDYWSHYGRLVCEGRETRGILNACRSKTQTAKDADLCADLDAAILNNDPSRCENFDNKAVKRFCLAAAKKDPSLCLDTHCKNKTYFIMALAANDPKLCNNIVPREGGDAVAGRMAWICKGGAAGDVSVCRQNSGYEKFRRSYCAAKADAQYQEESAIRKMKQQ